MMYEMFRLDPISLRKQNAREVFLVLRRLTAYNDRKYIESGGKSGDEIRVINGERVIFRKAGNSWH